MNTLFLMATILHCYVGSNTGSPDHQALHVLRCDTETGAAELVQSVKGCEGTTYFQLDRAGKWLYSVTGFIGKTDTRGAAVRFPVLADGRLGALEKIACLPCEAPCHVALSPDGKVFSFAAYCSATAGTVALDAARVRAVKLPDVGMGPNAKRQQKAYAHGTFHTPDGKLMLVCDLGTDKLHVFAHPESLGAKPDFTIATDPGDGPRHAVFSKDGRYLYVVNELSSSVIGWAWDGKTGFTRIGKWTMLPKGVAQFKADGVSLATQAAAIRLSEDGKVLMASNRGHDSIALYETQADGTLVLKGVSPVGGRPRDFEIMPGGKFVIVGRKLEDEIQVFRFDRAAWTLAPVGKPIAVWHPLCFAFGR